jgi:hypothetical protein
MGNFVPTVFPGGVTNADIDSFGARVPMLWPAQYYTWFSDFDRFLGAADSASGADWLTVAVGASTAVIADAANGVLLLTTAGTEDDGIAMQWQGGNPDGATPAQVAETFIFTPGKRLWFACRFQLSDVTQTDFVIGLAAATATPMVVVDGVTFSSVDGSAALTLESDIVTPLAASATLFTMVDATWYDVGFEYNGVDEIRAYLKEATSGVWNSVGVIGVTALPTTELALTLGLLTGETGANTASIDYIFAAKER